MEPSDGVNSARPTQNINLPAEASQPKIDQPKKTYVTTLDNNQSLPTSSNRHERENAIARKTIHNGMPAAIFKAKDYYGVMASECKLTIVGRFLRTRPQIEKIRSRFSERVPLKGSVKIGVYDNYNVFMDFTNEEDFNLVWFKRSMEIEGMQMWLQKWSPDFKPEEDLPVVPVWVLLPELPYHLHTWQYVRQILSCVGTPLALDVATRSRTRPSIAKVRVEIDLLKPLVDSMWIGQEDDSSPLKGFEQKIEYEGVTKYCKHCRKLGHSLVNCRLLEKKKKQKMNEVEGNNKDVLNNVIKGQPNQKETISHQAQENNNVLVEEERQENKQEWQTVTTRVGKKKNKKAVKKIPKKKSVVKFRPSQSQRNNLESNSKVPKQAQYNQQTQKSREDQGEASSVRDQNQNQTGNSNGPLVTPNQSPEMEFDGNMHHCIENSGFSTNEGGKRPIEKDTNEISGLNCIREKETTKSESLPSTIKNHKGIHLVVDLKGGPTCNQNAQVIQPEEDETESTEVFENNSVEHLDNQPDDPAEVHLREVVEKLGVSPVKRGRNKLRKKGNRKRDNTAPSPQERGLIRYEKIA